MAAWGGGGGQTRGGGRAGPGRPVVNRTAESLPSWYSIKMSLNVCLHETIGLYFLQGGRVRGTEAKSAAELRLVPQLSSPRLLPGSSAPVRPSWTWEPSSPHWPSVSRSVKWRQCISRRHREASTQSSGGTRVSKRRKGEDKDEGIAN